MFLVNSGNDPGIGGNANENAYPPLGIVSLATALEIEFGDLLALTLIDGQVDTTSAIIASIEAHCPDIVGISMYSTSTRNTIAIATAAKAVGATVILGNDHAAMNHREILSKVTEVDFISLNDIGEETLVGLVKHLLDPANNPSSAVPLLAFRNQEGIQNTIVASSFRPGRSLDRIASPNRLLLPTRYWDEYTRRFHGQARKIPRFRGDERVTTINRARGCAQMAAPCRYCGIMDLSIRYSSANSMWADVAAAREQIGASVFYEAFDSASSGKQILRSWLRDRPKELEDTYFKMYAQAFESDEDRVQVFKDLNVFCVNMGLDSGDDQVLKLLKGDKHSLDGNKKAVELYSKAGIEVYTSFVLFGLGDYASTEKSMKETLRFAEWLAKETSTVSFDAALMYPDRLSPIGGLIWNPGSAPSVLAETGWNFIDLTRLEEVSRKWRGEIFIDPIEIANDFAYVCGVDGDFLRGFADEIQDLSRKYSMNFGRSQGGTLVS